MVDWSYDERLNTLLSLEEPYRSKLFFEWTKTNVFSLRMFREAIEILYKQ